MFKSTRGNECVSASQAIISGIAKDSGLFLPINIEKFEVNNDLLNINYQDLTFKILRLYLDDYTDDEIRYCIAQAYNKNNFEDNLVDIKDFDDFSFLTLYHGPTLAFKDMALTILPYLLAQALKKNNDNNKTWILTATSGDTGSASLCGFSQTSTISTLVLYPNNGVSPLQELQMHAFQKNGSKCLSVCGNFDDCQNIVKKAFLNIKDERINLASANSINIGRLIPQIVYYYYAYISLVNKKRIKLGEYINVSVPTGNFGNILAAFLAKLMGLPINQLICASNHNNVLTEFFNTGLYNKNRPFYKTLSPSMDILVSSNLERYLYLISNDEKKVLSYMNQLSNVGYYELDKNLKEKLKDFQAYYSSDEEIKQNILDCYNKYHFLIDPHTACGYDAYLKSKKDHHYTLVVSTASPFKFPNAYQDLFNIKSDNVFLELHNLARITNTKFDEKIDLLKNVEIKKNILEIKDKSIDEILDEIKQYLGV